MSEGRRLSPSVVFLFLAIVLVIAGGASALPGRNKIDANDLKKNVVKAKHVAAGAVGSSEVADESLTEDDIDDLELLGGSFIRVVATAGADEATARTNAPEIPLATFGQLSIYGKCFHDNADDETFGEVYIRTTADGAIFVSRDEDDQEGGNASSDFLNTGTAETDRQIYSELAENDADFSVDDSEDWHAMAPDGTAINGDVAMAVKDGTLTQGNGVFGDGNVCLFAGHGIG